MSRLFVCNLPKNSTEQKLRELFSQKGTVTDCSLKYRQDDGKFRKFAFVGFSCEEEAQAAQRYFDNTYINTSRIKVAMAIDMGNAKPRPWSRHTKAAETEKAETAKAEKAETAKAEKAETAKAEKEKKAAAKKKKAEEKEAALLGELHQDPEFKEYLAVYSSRKQTTWDNDAGLGKDNGTGRDNDNDDDDNEDNDNEDDDNEDDHLKEEEGDAKSDSDEKESQNVKNKGAEEGKKVSDLEFLKSKMGESALLSSDDEEENDDVNVVSAKTTEKIEKRKATRKEQREDTKAPKQKFCIKMKGLKSTVKESSIREFFTPVKVKVSLPRNKNKLAIGIAFVECFSEKDLQAALARNKNFIGKHKVYLTRVEDKMPAENTTAVVTPKPKPWELKAQNEEEEESIAESGRLFVRNLPYICTEEDLQALFSAYGPVAELELPVDPITKKVKGFAHVTFMFPEHAVTARMELDYKEFKGRLMHILPGQERKDKYESAEKSSYKKQKDKKTKASASRGHNWNSLFLSGDNVATAMAAKYNTDKGHVLGDSDRGGGGGSLGVRLALEETQLVQETRQFLLDNGVALDSFSQAGGAKSQCVFIAKDLPPGTEAAMLQEVFGQYGTLARVILPPRGISAIVEFQEPSEAKRAFNREAYRRFKDRPLYLQWAPVAVFGGDDNEEKTNHSEARTEGKTEEEGEEREGSAMEIGEEEEEEREKSSAVKKDKTVEEEEGEESEGESEPNSTLYVKNINFNTTEATLLQVFSKAGQVRRVTIAKKKDVKNPGKFLSMGYGFVEYKRAAGAQEALKTLQKEELEGHQLQLKISQRDILQHSAGRKQQSSQQKGATKICVRNIPFQSSRKEITELFRVFGELKYVRVPKKASGQGIQGFAFVEFLTKQDAKRAFDALCHSTHLYGRRLVLEWANTAETVEELQFKTKRKFQGGGPPRKLRKQDLMHTLNKE